MKAILVILSLVAAGFCRADVQVLIHVVEMPQQRFSELLSEGESGDELFAKVHAEVSAGRAESVDTSVIRARAGERVSVFSCGGVTFPTEPRPPLLCTEVGTMPGQPVVTRSPDIRMGSFYFGFETRPVGVAWDTELSVSNGLIELRSDWRSVNDPGSNLFESWQDELGQLHQFKQPHFVTRSAVTSLILKSGRWVLASLSAGKAADGMVDLNRKVLVFIRADDLDAASQR